MKVLMLLFLTLQLNAQTTFFDIQGHRGMRGYVPENTITGFLQAVDSGCTTLEMDVVISMDSIVVVSHEPWFNPAITLTPSGDSLTIDTGKKLNLYKMTYQEISAYDVRTKFYPSFPLQQKIKEKKPTLSEVITEVEQKTLKNSLPKMNYNIEIKSINETDSIFHPVPKDFVRLVYLNLLEMDVLDRVTIQSFDIRALREMHLLDGSIPVALLVNNVDGVDKNIERLGFVPEVYSPYHQLLNEGMVRQIKSHGMKLIPWTVNSDSDIQRMLGFGVDGLISDYPNRVIRAVKK